MNKELINELDSTGISFTQVVASFEPGNKIYDKDRLLNALQNIFKTRWHQATFLFFKNFYNIPFVFVFNPEKVNPV
jgi:hypothetical protein